MFSLVKILLYLTVAILVSGYGYLALIRRDQVTPLDRKLPPMMLAILIVGYLSPTFWLLYAVLVMLPLVLGRTRIDSCVVFVVALLGVSSVNRMLTLGGMYITPMDAVHCLSLGLLAAAILRPAGGRPLAGRKFDLPAIILVSLTIIAQLRDQNLTTILRTAQYEAIWLAVPYYVISRSIRSATDINRLVMAMALGGFVLSVMSVYEAARSWPIYLAIDNRLADASGIMSQTLRMRAGLMRTATSFGESTSFSLFLAIALLAVMACRPAFRSPTRFLVAIGLILVGLVLAQSRSGWIAAAIGVLAYHFYLRNYARMAMWTAIMGTSLALLLFSAASIPRLSQTMGLSGDAVGTKDYRLELLRRGIEQIREHPLVGTSMAKVTHNMQDLMQGEHIIDFVNGYVYYGVTTGLPGIFALFMILASMAGWMLLKRGPVRRAAPPDRTGALVFAVATFFVVTAATSGFGGKPLSFLVVVLAIGSVHHLARRRVVAPPRPARRATPNVFAPTSATGGLSDAIRLS